MMSCLGNCLVQILIDWQLVPFKKKECDQDNRYVLQNLGFNIFKILKQSYGCYAFTDLNEINWIKSKYSAFTRNLAQIYLEVLYYISILPSFSGTYCMTGFSGDLQCRHQQIQTYQDFCD